MNPSVWYVPEVLEVRFMLVRTEEEEEPFYELYAIERGHTKVEDESIQDRKWEELEDPVCHG